MTQTNHPWFPVYNISKNMIISEPEDEGYKRLLFSVFDDLNEHFNFLNRFDRLLKGKLRKNIYY